MEDTKKELEALFDEMLGQLKYFKKKSYQSVFMESYERYRGLITSLPSYCEGLEGKERDAVIEELASVIPDYAIRKQEGVVKHKKSVIMIDYNMTMAVYVIPLITYQKFPENEKIAERMVALWNEKKVTDSKIQKADYETIEKGFKKRFCYITTAVCNSQNKPDDCYELTMLRAYRDQYLMHTEEGRRIVEEYYDIAPGIVLAIDMQKDAERIYEGIYEDYLMPCIRYAEEGKNEECKELYMDMVHHLQNKYLGS